MWGINEFNEFLFRHHFILKTECLWWTGINRRLHNLLFFHNWYQILDYYHGLLLLLDFVTITIVCIQSDIFHQSFSWRVNKFRIQDYKSPFCFAGPLRKSEFLIVFSFSFPVIYLQIHCSIQTFKLVICWLTSHIRGPRSHLVILGSQVPVSFRGPGSSVSGPTFPVCHIWKGKLNFFYYVPRLTVSIFTIKCWICNKIMTLFQLILLEKTGLKIN